MKLICNGMSGGSVEEVNFKLRVEIQDRAGKAKSRENSVFPGPPGGREFGSI